MTFINDNDYSVLIRNEIKDLLLEEYSETRLRTAEQMGISQVKNYLSGKYDVAEIFEAKGEGRNAHIVMIVLDCTLYHLYTATIPRKIPDIRSQRYQDAIDWLRMLAKGEALADLPKQKNKNGEDVLGIKVSSKYNATNQRW